MVNRNQPARESEVAAVMARAGTSKKAPSTKAAFLLRFEETGRIDLACKQTGIGRRTHYNWLESDSGYRAQFEQSRKRIVQLLEDEAYRRAVEGVEKPISVNGETTTIREYSDTLLIFLLKGAAPERYRERYEHALSAPGGGDLVKIEIVRVTARSEIEAPAERSEPRPNSQVIEATPEKNKPN